MASERPSWIELALGASRVVPVRAAPSAGPIDLVALGREVARIRGTTSIAIADRTPLIDDEYFEGLSSVEDCIDLPDAAE